MAKTIHTLHTLHLVEAKNRAKSLCSRKDVEHSWQPLNVIYAGYVAVHGLGVEKHTLRTALIEEGFWYDNKDNFCVRYSRPDVEFDVVNLFMKIKTRACDKNTAACVLYRDYCAWKKENVVSRTKFGQYLKALGYKSKRMNEGIFYIGVELC